MTNWEWPGSHLERVIDGDTIVAELTRDIGFNGTLTFQQHLRLNRINTPPVKTETGQRAKKYVAEIGTIAAIDITTVGPYKYGDEWMAEIEVFGIGNLSDALVKEGLAVYWDGHGPRPLGKQRQADLKTLLEQIGESDSAQHSRVLAGKALKLLDS